MDTETPSFDNSVNSSMVASAFRIARLSVISSSNCEASRPVSSRTPRMVAVRSVSWICTADRLTATLMGPSPASVQALLRAQASRSTHSPIGTISFERSATGMNSAGDMKPCCGWFQRISASMPVMRLDPIWSFGW